MVETLKNVKTSFAGLSLLNFLLALLQHGFCRVC